MQLESVQSTPEVEIAKGLGTKNGIVFGLVCSSPTNFQTFLLDCPVQSNIHLRDCQSPASRKNINSIRNEKNNPIKYLVEIKVIITQFSFWKNEI